MRFILPLFTFCFFLFSCQENNTPSEKKGGFTEGANTLFTKVLPEESNIKFRNNLVQTNEFNYLNYMYIYSGAGVAVGDINNDGLQDLYFVSNVGPNKLYLNKGGLKFDDITISSKTEDFSGFSSGVSMFDVNNDGWLDIYVCKAASLKDTDARRNLLFVNQKDGTFKEDAKKWGIDDPGLSTQIYPIDYDKDGDLDLYLVNYRYDFDNNTKVSGKIQAQKEEITSDQLYRNDGERFTKVTKQAGLWNKAWGLGAVISDFNDDGWDDIYLSNDFLEPDMMYINQRDGTFRNEMNQRFNHMSANSMGSDFADLNNDLLPDLITVDMLSDNYARAKENMVGMDMEGFNTLVEIGYGYAYMANMLHHNVGNGKFQETGQLSGVVKTDWSWSPLLADFDNDGLKDIFVSNGVDRDYTNQDSRKIVRDKYNRGESILLDDLLEIYPRQKMNNHIYKNNGDFSFAKKVKEWGLEDPGLSYGASYADLDNDGDLEIITNNLYDPAGIYKNNSNQNYIQVQLKGPQNNPFAVGSQVYVEEDQRTQLIEMYMNRGYESGTSNQLNFGLGEQSNVKAITVKWADGKVSKIEAPTINSLITVDYSTATDQSLDLVKYHSTKLSYDPMALGLNYQHEENAFNDYSLQLLLPQKQSTKGTGIAKADVDGDGLEDVFIGNAAGATAASYLQNPDGTFRKTNENLWKSEAKYEDANAIFFDADNDNDPDLYVVSAGYELKANSPLLQDRLYINDGKGNFKKASRALPTMLTSGKAIVAGDYDKDGDLDLFVGGNVVPGHYPNPPRSYLLKNENGTFSDVTANHNTLMEMGMVSQALFTDYDGDNDLDLLAVGEWMQPTFFNNANGSFSKVENMNGLDQTEGWWFSATQGDFDGDGDMDYVLGNLGKNNKFQPKKDKPLYIYAKDFDNSGTYDMALSKVNDGRLVPIRGKECSSEQNPFLLDKIKTYKEFASLDMKDIYGEDKLKDAFQLQAHVFETVYVENKGNGTFELTPLTNEAQMGPTLSVISKDVNNDGHLDIMGVGAIYDAEVETIRYDSNYGYVLLGDGKGTFTHSKKFDPFIDKDAKQLQAITLAGRECYMVVSNNAPLEVFSFQP
ncbi:MAG: VCBS repeat-containing protein [Bacteroidota bacterium]